MDEYINRNYRSQAVRKNKEKEFILCQEVTGTVDPRRIHCCVSNTNESFICGHTINKLDIKNPNDILVIMGLLNSKVMDWVFRKTSSNNHVGGYELKQLPIIIPKKKDYFINKVENILEKKKNNIDTSHEEEMLDVLIFRLYNLKYEWAKYINDGMPISKEEYDNLDIC